MIRRSWLRSTAVMADRLKPDLTTVVLTCWVSVLLLLASLRLLHLPFFLLYVPTSDFDLFIPSRLLCPLNHLCRNCWLQPQNERFRTADGGDVL